MTAGEPNFTGIYGGTANPLRQVFMMGVVWRLSEDFKHGNLDLLEVGSWAGASALTWGQALETHNEGNGSLTCVDAWKPYYDIEEIPDELSRLINEALKDDEPYRVFSDNMKFMPPSIDLTVRRGWSSEVLPTLPENSFHLVYLDSDHSYAAVSEDLHRASNLVVDGGIICGDDLELQAHEVDASIARERPKLDKAVDPNSGTEFHPGVALAVAEAFGPVSSWHGFWAMRKEGDTWQPVSLEGMPAQVPNYLDLENLIGLKAALMEYGMQ